MLKQTIHRVLSPFATLLPLSWLQTWSGWHHLSLFYHTVSDAPLPHVRHLYCARDTATFRADLDYLLRYYTPIHLSTWLDYYHDHKPLPPNTLLLTFDDGLAECYHIIAPILEEKGVPAVFFINSDFVDNRALMFRYKASLLIEELLGHSPLPFENLQQCWQRHGLVFTSVKESLLSIRWQEQALLDDLAIQLGYSFDDFVKKTSPYLTTPQLQDLLDRGFALGSHSQNHPRYHYLPLKAQLAQTLRSQEWLEKRFDLKQRVFAFPFTDYGVSKAFFNQVLGEAAFDMTFGGAGLKREQIRGQIQRWGVETQHLTPLPKLLHTEYGAYLLKALVGKQTIRRTWFDPSPS